MHYAFLLVWIVAADNGQSWLTLGEINWLVGQIGRNVKEIAGLIDNGMGQPGAVTSFYSALNKVNGRLEAPMKMRNCGPSRRDDHQIHRETLGASGSRGNPHEGRQVLAGNDFRGWPNGDDPARKRSGWMAFFYDQRGVQVF